MKDFLHHLFIPRESNNHRAKILHHNSIFFVVLFLFAAGFLISPLQKQFAGVLGVSTSIATNELLTITNEERSKQGLSELGLDSELSKAALEKAQDMFVHNYWAHNSPEGKTPWVFMKGSGYEYVYAGENLARGFSTSNEVVDAWMASPSHRANMLSSNYRDIGFAILDGKLLGEDTTLVVEMFGSKTVTTSQNTEAEHRVPVRETFAASVSKEPLVNSFSMSRNIGIFILSIFVVVLLLDMIIIKRRKIVRLVGHNTDHILFLVGIIILIVLFSKGIVL